MVTLNPGRRPRSPDFPQVIEKIFVRTEADRVTLRDRLKLFMTHMGDHPGIPRVCEYDKKLLQPLPHGSEHKYTITWFDTPGISLDEEYCQKKRHMTIDELRQCVQQISAILIPMHQAGVPHLDIQPDNIILVNRPGVSQTGTTDPVYALRRWGIGKFSLASYDDGSYFFLPPEVDNGDLGKPGTASDVYMLAAALYRAYRGDGIFAETETMRMEIRRQHRWEEPDLKHLPSPFRPLFREALAKNPAERPTIEKFRDKFEQAYQEMITRLPEGDTLAEVAAFIKAVAGKPMPRRTAIALIAIICAYFLYILGNNLRNLLQGPGKPNNHHQVNGGIGTERYTFKQHEASVKAALPSPDGTKMLSTDESGRVIVSKIDSQEFMLDDSLRYDGVPVISAAWAPDGLAFATLGQNGLVRLWQLQGDEYRSIERYGYHFAFSLPVSRIAWSSRGDFMVASGCEILVFKDVLQKGFARHSVVYRGHTDTVTCVAFSPDGKTALSGSNDMTAHLWNVKNGEMIAKFDEDFEDAISAVAFSPDGLIGIGCEDHTVQVRNGQEYYLLFWYRHNSSVNDLGFSEDSLFIASAANDQVIQIYGLDGNRRFIYRGHHASVTTVKWIPPNAHLGPSEWIISSSGNEIKVWRGR